MSQSKLTAIFARFAGREIHIDRSRIFFGETKAQENDATVAEMEAIAAQNGLELRLQFPGSPCSFEYKADRVNVWMEQDDAGKWRVSRNFEIG